MVQGYRPALHLDPGDVQSFAGHHDCAANPVDRATHEENVRAAVAVVTAWGMSVEVVGVFVDNQWQVQPVSGAFSAKVTPELQTTEA